MKKGNRLLMAALGLLSLIAIVLFALVTLNKVKTMTIIRQDTEIVYQESSENPMTIELSYLASRDHKKEITQISFNAAKFPVYIIEEKTQEFGPFEVVTLKAVIAPAETSWPENGMLDCSEMNFLYDDGSTDTKELGSVHLVKPTPAKGPFEITETKINGDGSFQLKLNATKMLHLSSISSTLMEEVRTVLSLTINGKPEEDWKGLLAPQGEIVIEGKFINEAVPVLQSMQLSPVITFEDEKGNLSSLQITIRRNQQKDFSIFNLLSYTKKGGNS